MEKTIGILIAGLGPGAKKALGEAQSAWIKQRDKEIDHLIEFYSKMQDSMSRMIYAETTKPMARDRALKLGHMVELPERRNKK